MTRYGPRLRHAPALFSVVIGAVTLTLSYVEVRSSDDELPYVRTSRTAAVFEGQNSFTGHDGRVFIISPESRDGIIRNFNAGQGDLIRILGFGFHIPQEVRKLMKQDGADVALSLPNGRTIRIVDIGLEALPDSCLQLELDRSQLTETFKDDFDTFQWDSQGQLGGDNVHGKWRTNYGYGGISAEASRSLPNEGQVYVDPAFRGTNNTVFGLNPFRIVNGVLEIRGDHAPSNILPHIWGRKYTSGLITTKTHFAQQYGVFEIRARLPKGGKGYFPAFWLLPTDGSWPPEIDVFEMLGHQPTTLYTTAHSLENGVHTALTISSDVPDLTAEFHQIAVDWEPEEIRWYFDGVEVARMPTPSDMHKPMYLIANLAIGASWPGRPDETTQFAGTYEIDWIRAYKWRSSHG